MKPTPSYVYKLVVRVPAEYAYPYEPADFHRNHVCMSSSNIECRFTWPRRRQYLTKKAAENRAQQLREWGAIVSVHRSQPVEFGPLPESVEPRDIFKARLKRAVRRTAIWLQEN